MNFRLRKEKITTRYIASQFQPIYVENGWMWASLESGIGMYVPTIDDIEEQIIRLINTVKDTEYRYTSCGRIDVRKDKKTNKIKISLGKKLSFTLE